MQGLPWEDATQRFNNVNNMKARFPTFNDISNAFDSTKI